MNRLIQFTQALHVKIESGDVPPAQQSLRVLCGDTEQHALIPLLQHTLREDLTLVRLAIRAGDAFQVVGANRRVQGHWKSPNTSMVTLALAGPSVGNCGCVLLFFVVPGRGPGAWRSPPVAT